MSNERFGDSSSDYEWKKYTLSKEENGSFEQGEDYLQVSNQSVPLPEGTRYLRGFLSIDNEREILREIDESMFKKEGFDVQKRVQRFRLSNSETSDPEQEQEVPASLHVLSDRLYNAIGVRAEFVTIEDMPISGYKKAKVRDYASNHVPTTFESLTRCHDGCSRCFVAYIPIGNAVIQHWNRPVRRAASCWNLESPDHWTDVRIDRGSAVIRMGDNLHNWRSCLVDTETSPSDDTPRSFSRLNKGIIRVIKFYTLPEQGSVNHGDDGDDAFGYIASSAALHPPILPLKPLNELLTIVITTSPIKSNPSTELLERALDTFIRGGADFAYECRKVIICDGFRTKEDSNHDSVTRKHANAKQAMRNGIVTMEQAENYRLFKLALRNLCTNASSTSPFRNAEVEELDSRHGYGFALRHALQYCVKTQFVCVVQHDRTLMRPTPIQDIVRTMRSHPNIKYIGISMRSNLLYRDIFLSKYGRVYFDQLGEMILRPPELLLDSSMYGPNSLSVKGMECHNDKMRENLRALTETYQGSYQHLEHQNWLSNHASDQQKDPSKHQLTLTPTLFWYDNVHIAETAHYRDFVFNPSYKMVAKGGFVEDKLSPVMKRTVERLGLKDGHSRFGCFLLDDHSGLFFTGHLDGGSYITSSSRGTMLSDPDREKVAASQDS